MQWRTATWWRLALVLVAAPVGVVSLMDGHTLPALAMALVIAGQVVPEVVDQRRLRREARERAGRPAA